MNRLARYLLILLIAGISSTALMASAGSKYKSRQFADNSVLKDGEWYKFRTTAEGVHKIAYEDLVAAGIDPATIDPSSIQLFGNVNGRVPEKNSAPRVDDLVENSILVIGGDDGSFDPGDHFLFYANPSVNWKINPFLRIFQHEINIYDEHVYFFLRFNHSPGKRIEDVASVNEDPNYIVRSYDYYTAHQKELHSLTKSGQEWYGEHINKAKEMNFSFPVDNIETGSEVDLRAKFAGRTSDESLLEFLYEDQLLDSVSITPLSLTGVKFAISFSRRYTFLPQSPDNININLRFSPFDGNSEMWLDYLELNLRRKLVFEGGQFSFRDWDATGNNKVAEFILRDESGDANIWEITDPFAVQRVMAEQANDSLHFVLETDSLRHFIAWNEAALLKPEFIEKVPAQNLHALQPADLVIVAHPDFMENAAELAALHVEYDNLSSVVVSTKEVYNEFGGGKLDVGAIRDFVKMLYERGQGKKPRYLLLFGDASYDPKQRDGEQHNFIPAYESEESLNMTKSFVTDDFFGLMDEDEGADAAGAPDVGVGRLPVSNQEQVQAIMNKIEHYISNSSRVMGNWRNKLVFVADDEDGNTHLNQAEGLAEIVSSDHPQYHLNKIYLDAFVQEKLPSGSRYPMVNEAIDEAVSDGSLFVNYTGHGGELGWADEKVLGIPTINNWENFDALPVFMTATCEFSRFDNPEFISGGEFVILNPKGGGIALFTTSRLSFSQTNYGLNKLFYQNCFEPINGEMPRLGDLIRLSKQSTNSGIYTKNFVLLGDPALQPAYPAHNVQVSDMIVDGSTENDSVMALSHFTLKGMVTGGQGKKNTNFNGVIYPQVFDKPTKYTTMGNDHSSFPVTFNAHTKMIYEAKASVQNGDFSFTFVVPKDIDFEFGEGRIYFYAADTVNSIDANGYLNFVIGGVNQNAVVDETGPDISIYLNNQGFSSGDVTDKDPLMMVHLQDESGINSSGNGIGHDIVAILDGNTESSIILNDFYEPALDDFTRGEVLYPLYDLALGKHNLQLKAWDVYNNSSIKTIEFTVKEDHSIVVNAVKNKPNPFIHQTVFEIDHAQFMQTTDVHLMIFNTYGKLVEELNAVVRPQSGSITELSWDGIDSNGNRLRTGVYPYMMLFSNDQGYKSKYSGKLIIVN